MCHVLAVIREQDIANAVNLWIICYFQKIPADIPASPNPVSNAEEPQKETDEEERVAGSPKQTPDTPVTPFAQVMNHLRCGDQMSDPFLIH